MGPDSSRAATPAVTDNVQRQRYEVTVDGHTAFLVYSRRPGPRVLVHTEVPEELRGRGLAPVLARFALEKARADGVRIVPQCPFVQAFLRKHPEYADLVA
jgi:predicted GNAT family acetyltransferase